LLGVLGPLFFFVAEQFVAEQHLEPVTVTGNAARAPDVHFWFGNGATVEFAG
jgi:hypothetical protein